MPHRQGLNRTVPYWPTDQWEDLRIVPGAFTFAGASDPVLNNWQPGGAGATFKVYVFATNDEVFFTCQIPHSWREGSELRPHIHWTARDRGVAEAGKTVAWKIDYSIASPEGDFLASSTVDLTDTCSGVNDHHELTVSGSIPGTDLEVSAIFMGRLYRDAGDTWAGAIAAQLPALLEFDLHYLVDSLGSLRELYKV